MKIKSISKKLIICFMIFLMLFNFMIASCVKCNTVLAATDEEIATEAEAETENLAGGVLNGLAGVLTWIPKAIINILSKLIQVLAYFVINTGGHTGEVSATITPFDIFFNKFTLTNINIFQMDDIQNQSSGGGKMVYQIREIVSVLYYVARIIAVGILLITLITIAIKAALASLAEKKAEVKRMFVNWFINVALLFLLDFLMLLLINLNEFIVSIVENVADGVDISSMISSLSSAAFSANFLLGWGCTIAYAILAVQTMFFVVIYIIRFFKTCFFIVFAPVPALTYSIDKANSGKAIAFNKWLKEFCANVFVQSVHCVIYVIIIAIPMSAVSTVTLGSLTSLTVPVLLCIALLFVPKAEKFIMSIFGLDDATTITTVNSTVNTVNSAVQSAINMRNNNVYQSTANADSSPTKFGTDIGQGNTGQSVSDRIHTFRDRAANWLDSHATSIDPNLIGGFGNNSLTQTTGGVVPRNQSQIDGEVSSNDNYEDDDNIIDVPYEEIDIDDDEHQNSPILALPQNDDELDTDKVAAAVKSTYHEDEDKKSEEEQIETEEEVEINKENLEEFFENEDFFSRVKHNKGNMADNYLDDKEKEEFISDLENILEKYKNGQTDFNEVMKRFEDAGLKVDDKLINDLFDKFGLKMKNSQEQIDEAKKLTATELTNDNLEKFINDKNIISNWKNESNYRSPELKKEFIADLMDALEKYKNGMIDINDIKKRFSAYGLSVDDETMSDLIKEFAPEKLEPGSQEENTQLIERRNNEKPQIIEQHNDESTELNITGDNIVNMGSLRLPKDVMNKILLSTRNESIKASKELEILGGDITAKGDYSTVGLRRFNTRILDNANKGKYSQTNLQQAEEAVRREGDIAVKRLENYRKDQTEANARMLTPAGKELAILEREAQQAGLIVSAARIQTTNSSVESRTQNMSVSQQTINIPTNNSPINNEIPTNQSGNVLNDLNNRKKYA